MTAFSKNQGFLEEDEETVEAAILDSSPLLDAAALAAAALGSFPLLRWVSCFLSLVLSKFSESDIITSVLESKLVVYIFV